ncbi:MAG: hypothetical protein A2151_05175 [Candidatus Muproteobacteria bacterium RBG_16_65_34]|uniref:Uncharacterized protein n=1 Tax=Candidatus Muproteobacteria bacterium RBG_16_65_34 TaxID=1817760 RepID=A0A1F6TSA7_9PROT|nr:MAG: hypothetical protein A2151_05175 [Candidatus Muproteobacteria bacterium RBG_16_65_34]
MNELRQKSPGAAQKEALISLTALAFIEEHALLPPEKLADARGSLQALFLRASGEETLLRKLIEILRSTRSVQRSFARVADILTGVGRAVTTIGAKIAALRTTLDALKVSAEENAAFVGPFLSFSLELQFHIEDTQRRLAQYLEFKEQEARAGQVYHIAREARAQLKERLAGGLAAHARGEVEQRIKQEVVSAFDYSGAEGNFRRARRQAQAEENEIRALLDDLKLRCRMAQNPETRAPLPWTARLRAPVYGDVFTMFDRALYRHPRLEVIADAVLELFRLYQHAYGMFRLDFENLSRSIETMSENPETYFEAKEEDTDIRSKREKLRRIEGLVPFLERSAEILRANSSEPYSRFSQRVSDLIPQPEAPWIHIAAELLHAKVVGEAELSAGGVRGED